ncbi:phenylacetyl-CoA ligase [Mycena vulgaris]|nr:phenylacetyl-CoA ligase [Mycena vulgaris]
MTWYQSTVGSLAAPPDSLTVPEFMLDNLFLQPDSNDPAKPDWICLIDDLTGRQVSFSELRSRTEYLSSALHEQRKIMALVSHNDIDYPVCVWAAHRLGGIVAPMSPAMTTDELAHLLKVANPSVIIVQTESVSLVKAAAKSAGLIQPRMIVMDANMGSDLEYPTTGSLIAYGKNLPPFSQPALTPGEGKTKLAFLSFSSGTTGLPKAVSISHYNVISNILQAEALNHVYDPQLEWAEKRYRPGGVCSGDIYGLVVNLHFIIYARMTLVVTAKFNFEKMLDNISRYRITNLLIVPPQALLMCNHPAVQRYDISSVRSCMIAAAPISAELTQNFLRVMPAGIHLGQGYGINLNSVHAHLCSLKFPISPKVGVLGSGGKLMPGTTAKVVKSDGTLGSVGERGELYLQGPQVTLGYYKNTAATNETYIDGWLRTGDEACFDEEGNLFIVDRVKELIKVKGNQVAPAELEGHLLGHPDVADVAVIGVPDDFAGELPYAFIVLEPQIASSVKNDSHVRTNVQDSIFKHVSASKSSYKWLTGGIAFVESIPKSPSGKILRKDLRKRRGMDTTGIAKAKL